MDTQLAVKVLKNTALNVKHTEGIIIQSDLGSQYTSNLFEAALAEVKIHHSYSRNECPYDNACIESFHSVLKKEEVNPEQAKEKMPLNGLLIGGGILAAFIGLLIYFKKKRKNE